VLLTFPWVLASYLLSRTDINLLSFFVSSFFRLGTLLKQSVTYAVPMIHLSAFVKFLGLPIGSPPEPLVRLSFFPSMTPVGSGFPGLHPPIVGVTLSFFPGPLPIEVSSKQVGRKFSFLFPVPSSSRLLVYFSQTFLFAFLRTPNAPYIVIPEGFTDVSLSPPGVND